MKISAIPDCFVRLATVAALAVAPLSVGAKDEIFLTSAPTAPPEKTRELYQPLADHLSKVTGKKFVVTPAKTFLEYTNNMRECKYDMLFDGPAFASWRMSHLDHAPVVKLPGSIVFVVVTREDARVTKVRHLAGKKVCSFSSPNMLTLGFLDLFPSAASQPVIVKAESFQDTLNCVRNGEGAAAIMRDTFWNKRKPEEKEGLRVLYKAKTAFPNRAFTITKAVDEETRAKIAEAMLSEEVTKLAEPILSRFQTKAFVPMKATEYQGIDRLLRSVYGF